MVDMFRRETLAGPIHFHRLDGSDVLQLVDDIVALDIRIQSVACVIWKVSRVRTGRCLSCRLRPRDAFAVRRTVGVQPEIADPPAQVSLARRRLKDQNRM